MYAGGKALLTLKPLLLGPACLEIHWPVDDHEPSSALLLMVDLRPVAVLHLADALE